MKRAVAISLALAIAGCGGSTIDGGELEDEIKEDAAERELVLDDVDCPSRDLEEGDTFTCTVTLKGQPTELEVAQTDDDGSVSYDFRGLVEGPAVDDSAGDEASVRSVIDALNKDVTALCDYATPAYREEIAGNGNCAKAVLAEYDSPFLEEYVVAIDADDAAASADSRTVTLERQQDGSWLITDVR
jgi:hypothetical protein